MQVQGKRWFQEREAEGTGGKTLKVMRGSGSHGQVQEFKKKKKKEKEGYFSSCP